MKEIKNIEIIERFINTTTADVDVELDVEFIDGEHVKCMYPLGGIMNDDAEEFMEENECSEDEYIDTLFFEFYEEDVLNEILSNNIKEAA